MMRILRLYAPSLIGDHTLCYVSTNREGNVCINDVETPVLWARAGEPLDGEERAAAMTVVLPPDAKLNEALSKNAQGTDLPDGFEHIGKKHDLFRRAPDSFRCRRKPRASHRKPSARKDSRPAPRFFNRSRRRNDARFFGHNGGIPVNEKRPERQDRSGSYQGRQQ